MQLSTSNFSPDTSLAAVLFPEAAATALSNPPAGDAAPEAGANGFAAVFSAMLAPAEEPAPAPAASIESLASSAASSTPLMEEVSATLPLGGANLFFRETTAGTFAPVATRDAAPGAASLPAAAREAIPGSVAELKAGTVAENEHRARSGREGELTKHHEPAASEPAASDKRACDAPASVTSRGREPRRTAARPAGFSERQTASATTSGAVSEPASVPVVTLPPEALLPLVQPQDVSSPGDEPLASENESENEFPAASANEDDRGSDERDADRSASETLSPRVLPPPAHFVPQRDRIISGQTPSRARADDVATASLPSQAEAPGEDPAARVSTGFAARFDELVGQRAPSHPENLAAGGGERRFSPAPAGTPEVYSEIPEGARETAAAPAAFADTAMPRAETFLSVRPLGSLGNAASEADVVPSDGAPTPTPEIPHEEISSRARFASLHATVTRPASSLAAFPPVHRLQPVQSPVDSTSTGASTPYPISELAGQRLADAAAVAGSAPDLGGVRATLARDADALPNVVAPDRVNPLEDEVRGSAAAAVPPLISRGVERGAMLPERAVVVDERDAGRPVISAPAKTAAAASDISAGRGAVENPRAKSFLRADSTRVTTRTPGLGIDVAKSASAMAVAPTPELEASVAARPDAFALDAAYRNEPHVAAVEARAENVAKSEVDSSLPEPQVASAHRAVEVVLHNVDRIASREQHAVNLQFSVGGDALDVRVELHANEVRAIFRTESAELRSALAQEWNAAAANTTRSVTPVFTSNDAGGFSAFSGDAANQQRDANARRTPEEKSAAAISKARRGSARAEVTEASAPLARPLSSRVASGTSRHLHTLA